MVISKLSRVSIMLPYPGPFDLTKKAIRDFAFVESDGVATDVAPVK